MPGPLLEYWGLDVLLVGDFDGRLRWLVEEGASVYLGPYWGPLTAQAFLEGMRGVWEPPPASWA